MEKVEIRIKNMVCPRCITAVEELLNDLKLPFDTVLLGQVNLKKLLSEDQKIKLAVALSAKGFELLESEKSALVAQIKAAVISKIHHSAAAMKENFSTFLSKELSHEYTSLSKLFSSVEGITIEKFITAQKIEKAKELLFYDEVSLSDIAFQLDYNSAAYLSAQFKKETGMTPSEFKKQSNPRRKSLDSI